jgi:hypothetical protein
MDEQRTSYKDQFFTSYNGLVNLPTIKESQIQIYAYLYRHAFIPSVGIIHGLVLIKLYTHQNICKNNLYKFFKEKKEEKTAQIGTNVRIRVFNAGLLARNQFAPGRSCDRPTRSRFTVVFLGPRANAEIVPKFHVALYASHAALPL